MESYWFATHPLDTPPALEIPDAAHFDVVVAGAGLTGLTTAVLLIRSGLSVAVVEARTVGAVATGNTTAKLSLLQGLVLSEIQSHQSDDVLRAYVEANRQGQAWLLRFLEANGVACERRTAYTYATTGDGVRALQKELEAAHLAGLDVQWATETELPFPVGGVLKLEEQYQFHPLEVLDALAAEFRSHGGAIFEQARLTDVDGGAPLRLTTSRGELSADRLVLATGVPILDRGGHFAKLLPMRSYATAYRLPAGVAPPQGMYLSADEPTRSLRTLPGGLLMVGGSGHVVGRADSPAAHLDDLDRWATDTFPGAERTHAWSAQDYRAVDRVPYVGPLPGGQDIHVATGYNKWGMTNGVAAALNLSGQLLDGQMEWAQTLNGRSTSVSAIASGVNHTLKVAGNLVKEWVQAEISALPEEAPAEGDGVVGRVGGKPVAASTVDGATCRVSGVCTHMGGVLRWNDAERSWDCPLHGSRFAPDGRLLEGPAVRDLDAVDQASAD